MARLSRAPIQAQTDLVQSLQSLLETLGDRPWLAIIELALIGSVIYTILRFFHGTRGARLMRGVFSILAVSFAVVWLLAEKLESERIKVLYPYFMLGVFLVSLVAFQSELRRILLRLGEGRWLRRWFHAPLPSIEPMVQAVERLSKMKIGALIAVDRTGEVGALIETGVRLDAQVSAELLETIFWPGTALHDLGVIVHADRIIAAGCQFPLAESGELDRSLGSRHRAALGMSQEAEAVVIVVSEETGSISVALRGRMRRSMTPDALRTVLKEELQSGAAPRPPTPSVQPAPAATLKAQTDGTSQVA